MKRTTTWVRSTVVNKWRSQYGLSVEQDWTTFRGVSRVVLFLGSRRVVFERVPV